MRGFEVIARLTDHFRKHTGSATKPLHFELKGSTTVYRAATVRADGNRTVVTLVRVEK